MCGLGLWGLPKKNGIIIKFTIFNSRYQYENTIKEAVKRFHSTNCSRPRGFLIPREDYDSRRFFILATVCGLALSGAYLRLLPNKSLEKHAQHDLHDQDPVTG